jgi:hypothetical protein
VPDLPICDPQNYRCLVASWDENQRTLEITGVAGSVFYGTTRNRCGMFESA